MKEHTMNIEKMESGIKLFLEGLGVDTKNQHTIGTPKRVARAWAETLGKGYLQDPSKILNIEFSDKYDSMVIIKDVPFCSTCAHHLIPFYGKAKIGYIPNGKVTGLSKLARILDVYARRLQIQEQVTVQVAEAIKKYLKPKGVGVILEAEHLCMTHRGVQKPGSITVTSHLIGAMRTDAKTRAEFLSF
jgi:GTP cyclohydrolase I